MIKKLLLSSLYAVSIAHVWPVNAQQIANVNEDYDLLAHGIEQYEQGHFVQAIHSLERYLNTTYLPTKLGPQERKPHLDYDMAQYYLTIAKIKYGTEGVENLAQSYVLNTVNPTYRERVAFHLAHYFFNKKDYENAIKYYDIAGIHALNNEEIAIAKFELAYSYFVNNDFNRAFPLFASIKEVATGKYYNQGNYYYGIIAYNKKEYDLALRSFDRIYHLPEYEDILPYYIAEIHYFKGEEEKVLDFGHRYLDRERKLYYHKELNQLVGQVYYNQERYKLALPYLEYYYNQSDQIRREQLYQLANTHYKLQDYAKAITFFKPLSNVDDSLGHHAMYLLADAYLKSNDKLGAKNAYSIAATMTAFPKLKQDATYNYALLASETGDNNVAIQTLNRFVTDYPQAKQHAAAKELLITLLANSENYDMAYDILSKMNINTPQLKKIFQQVALSNGIKAFKEGNKINALKNLNESLEYPQNAALRAVGQFWKSFIAYDDKKYNESAQLMNAFVQYAESQPEYVRNISPEATLANAYTHLGYTAMQLEQYDEARKSFTLAGDKVATEASMAKETKVNTILQADAAFMNKNYNEAEILYDKALSQNVSTPDYAIYQKAIIAGINGSADRKINLLRSIVKDHKGGSQYAKAQYELANSLLEIGQKSEAISIYNEIVNDATNPMKADAIYKIGVTELSGTNTSRAIQFLKEYITKYPNGKDYIAAHNALRGAYVTQGSPGAYYQFLKDEKIAEPQGMSSRELAFYEAAENKYSDEEYQDAITQYTNYINDFPNGNNILQAYFFRAESKRSIRTDSLGLNDYYKVIDLSSDSEYGKLAMDRIADIYQQYNDYERAIDALSLLLTHTPEEAEKAAIHYKIVNNYDKLGQLSKAGKSIDFLNRNTMLINATEQQYLQLVAAKKAIADKDYAQAETMLVNIIKEDDSELQAQARYFYGLSLFKQSKYTQAEQAVDNAISKNQNHSYWLEKSYVLISEVLLAQQDYFNARATLQSVIKNARNKEIAAEAKQVLSRVDEAEKNNGKVINQD